MYPWIPRLGFSSARSPHYSPWGSCGVLLIRLIRARKLLIDAGVPLRNKALVWAAAIYTVCPVDLIPDPVYLDDIGFLLLALRSLSAHGPDRSGAALPHKGSPPR